MSPPAVIPRIVDQYVVDTPFLWILRDRACRAPHYVASELAALDKRIEAHIDGLREAGDYGVDAAREEFERHPEPGEAFVAAVLALEDEDPRQFLALAEAASDCPEAYRGIVSATGWVDPEHLREKVGPVINHSNATVRAMAVAVHSVRRVDPGDRLAKWIVDAPPVSARALRLAGELGRIDAVPLALDHLGEGTQAQRFWAAWTATRLGDRQRALDALAASVRPDPEGWRALEMTVRAKAYAEAAEWLKKNFTGNLRVLIAASRIIGDASHLTWLGQQLENPVLAKIAGESISGISGIDLVAEGLVNSDAEYEGEDIGDNGWDTWFKDWESDLPMPDVKRLSNRLKTAKAVSAEPAEVFREGSQRLRRLAALEAALLSPRSVYWNASARLDA